MDHARLLEIVVSRDRLEQAIIWAYNDRLGDAFYDPFEMDWVPSLQESILRGLQRDLADVAAYRPGPAFSYLLPKSRLCFRYMVYVPFRDLVVRYALVSVLADVLDHSLSPTCFAHRRARGTRARRFLLHDYARRSWPAFCDWQADCARRYPVMLGADISACYDSVCHEQLLGLLAEALGIPPEAPLLGLLETLLRVPVISYSRLDGRAGPARIRRQGLATGSNGEGFLANLYLRDIDAAMSRLPGIAFGRYVDDIRIFARSRKAALRALAVLQELLLERGLNLNAAKTAFAEPPGKSGRRLAASPDYLVPEGEGSAIRFTEFPASVLDQRFERFSRRFRPAARLESDQDAKDYCRFMSSHQRGGHALLALSGRRPAHADTLAEILVRWPGASRHAAWLLFQCAAEARVPAATRQHAARRLFESLVDENVSNYAKYRLLHHLTKYRWNFRYGSRFLDGMDRAAAARFIATVRPLLARPAFELNLGALFAIGCVSAGGAAFPDDYAGDLPQPVAEPLQNLLFELRYGLECGGPGFPGFLTANPLEEAGEQEWGLY